LKQCAVTDRAYKKNFSTHCANPLTIFVAMRRRLDFWFCIAVVTATSCSHSAPPAPALPIHVRVPWSYEGPAGPAHWNKLDPEYATCGFGTTQSPIDIAKTTRADLPDILFHYQPSKLTLLNTGFGVEADVSTGNSIEINGELFDLVQLQIHVPSEHSINGKLAEGEIQLVHRNAARELAVIAVLLRAGLEDTTLRDLWNNLPSNSGVSKDLEREINLEEILPIHRQTYRYEGSQTVPPCDEIAKWFVLRDAMHVSARQLAAWTALFGPNNRPVQPLNHRMILEDN
jgi:carbonic anhydrase